ncbi:acetate/propionate family kinase [Patescibacteria group bacterium]|nr:acetate/propionate family kinase [Patescibacteria group bacterium]MBU1889885.1 acetate/propionate family kinase [Patescibacteria group bacterium]
MNSKHKYILVINSGSATLKFSLLSSHGLKVKLNGIVERIGLKDSFIQYQEGKLKPVHIDYPKGVISHTNAIHLVLGVIELLGLEVGIVGHRVVHGGKKLTRPMLVNKAILKQIEECSVMAPLHNPANVAGIKACIRLLPGIKNVVHFDTAFHATLKPESYLYALPNKYYTQHNIRKYGFHGLSHQYVAERAALKLKRPLSKLNLITCHLGSGCSLTAIMKGKSIDTTMGFTPLEGLVMATRCGDIDPAIVLYLINQIKLSTQQVQHLLNKESGWKGLSGISSDLREVLIVAGYKVPGFTSKKKYNPKVRQQAKTAIDVLVYRIQKYLGSYLARLPRTDAIVFTAGIGERNSTIRSLVLKGIRLPKETKMLVIPTYEEYIIARATLNFLKK